MPFSSNFNIIDGKSENACLKFYVGPTIKVKLGITWFYSWKYEVSLPTNISSIFIPENEELPKTLLNHSPGSIVLGKVRS